MNLGQSLLAIGALLILSLTVLRMNNNILGTEEVVLDSKIGVLATSIGASIIEQATKLAFDENTNNNSVSSIAGLTLSTDLGQEIPGILDDFDDYHGHTQQDTIYTIPFVSECAVTYINPGNPNGSTTNRTWHKKLTIRISSDFSRDTLELSTIYSYWYFR
ncbi:MAG: hypothetical protein KGZ85_01380 [Ignavibacterium sp.]|nr:hypothetical protein [Ignavibacterium sp.]